VNLVYLKNEKINLISKYRKNPNPNPSLALLLNTEVIINLL